jgi:hypothetical protein
LGEVADFARHDREPASLFAGPRCFDGRVQGEQIRLEGDFIDDADDVGDAAASPDFSPMRDASGR